MVEEPKAGGDDVDPGRPDAGDWADFARRLKAVMDWPLVAGDPVCQSILRSMSFGPDPAMFAFLMQRLTDRGVELAAANYGTVSTGIARRGPEQRLALDDDGPPPRLMLRL